MSSTRSVDRKLCDQPAPSGPPARLPTLEYVRWNCSVGPGPGTTTSSRESDNCPVATFTPFT